MSIHDYSAVERDPDLQALDAHVAQLPGGSYWYSNDDTCGVVNALDASKNWHRHADGAAAARRLAAASLPKPPESAPVEPAPHEDAHIIESRLEFSQPKGPR